MRALPRPVRHGDVVSHPAASPTQRCPTPNSIGAAVRTRGDAHGGITHLEQYLKPPPEAYPRTEDRFDMCVGDNALIGYSLSLWVLPGTDIHAVFRRLTALLPPHVPQPQLECVFVL